MLPAAKVKNPTMKIIAAHFQSPLKIAGKKPKKNVVQEKPTGAFLISPVFGFFNTNVSNAISILLCLIIKKYQLPELLIKPS